MSDLLRPEFLGYGEVVRRAGETTRKNAIDASRAALGMQFSAQSAGVACFGSVMSRPTKEVPVAIADTKLRRATIHSAIFQGIHAVEYCIATASYAQAAALVRQEIEAAEGLRGIRQGHQKDRATPRLKALRHLGRAYSDLTGLAHLSTHDLLSRVVSKEIGDVDNTFNDSFARYIFGVHIVALVGVILDASELRPFSSGKSLSPDEEAWLASVCGWLDAEGFLTLERTKSSG